MRGIARTALCGLLIGCALGFGAGSVHAAQQCAAIRYIDGLRQVVGDLSAPSPESPRVAAEVRSLINTFPDSSRILTPVANDLEAQPPDVSDAQATLRAEVAVLSLPPGATCDADLSPARSQLHDVYAAPVFAGLDRTVQPSLLDRVIQWIESLLNRAGQALGVAGSIAVGAAVLLLVLLLVGWRVRNLMAAQAAAIAVEPPGDTDDPAREWQAAGRAATRGEYREATRRAFRSALLEVARRGRLAVDPSWTTHELLRATRADAALVTVLAPASAAFDRAWYSGRVVSEADWDHARRLCDSVRTVARSRAPAATA